VPLSIAIKEPSFWGGYSTVGLIHYAVITSFDTAKSCSVFYNGFVEDNERRMVPVIDWIKDSAEFIEVGIGVDFTPQGAARGAVLNGASVDTVSRFLTEVETYWSTRSSEAYQNRRMAYFRIHKNVLNGKVLVELLSENLAGLHPSLTPHKEDKVYEKVYWIDIGEPQSRVINGSVVTNLTDYFDSSGKKKMWMGGIRTF